MAFERYLAIISWFLKLIIYLDFTQVMGIKIFNKSLIWIKIIFIYIELGGKLGCKFIYMGLGVI